MDHTYRLVISCPDRVGIVARVSQFVADQGGWLTEANYHADADNNWFFMRNEIRADSLRMGAEAVRDAFAPIAQEYEMAWELVDSSVKRKVVILASHASHCIADILHRWHSGELDCDIPCVISNHENLRSMVEWHGIPFEYVKIDPENKMPAHTKIMELTAEYQADCVVLARYMQIIQPEFCRAYSGRMINIHHSFLPSFIGANPYQKAFDRGVKLIGATSHYVTEQLDEGPIIEQDVIRVSHRHSKDDLVRLGKDVEKSVLARALRNHIEDRVLVLGNKTVVFD
ncbi:Formyltetrahydrofolate deformylase [Zhongshania aliphaticivorans]|uniref:Formyltetrahydrofolate deformylase n=1 Tax=Zhongshania aliphaticivorans TaxID=1470434 RepID=A0A5S9NJ64_9GAMM|nr:formyltetrahydrofolate deformylase [Zhongshania aliphaticivorans]CAA0089811.1 Formyltetrahydrofolate deformylase [Zhongshania aliphaticivorans]CAA0096843.1 Formyltetrahydrofolate deformylase [Zhongshania aliphaticivorans]